MSDPAHIPELVQQRLDGDLADDAWQLHLTEHGEALSVALARETAVRASLRTLPRERAPAAVRDAILAHAARARAAALAAPAPAAPQRIIRHRWWSVALLAAACVVVVVTLDHGDRGHMRVPSAAASREGAVSSSDGPVVAKLESSRKADAVTPDAAPDQIGGYAAERSRRENRSDVKNFGARAESEESPGEPTRSAVAPAAAAPAGVVTNQRDHGGLPLDSAAKGKDEKADTLDEKNGTGDLEVAGIESEQASKRNDGERNLRKDAATKLLDSTDAAIGQVPTASSAGHSSGSPPSVVQRAPGGAAPAATPPGSDGAAGSALADSVGEDRDLAVNDQPGADKSTTLKGGLPRKSQARPPAPTEESESAAAPPMAQSEAAKPSALPKSPTFGLMLALTAAHASMTVDNPTDQPISIPRAALVLEGFNASGVICWSHATGQPPRDEVVPAQQSREWKTALNGDDAPPAAAVSLRLRTLGAVSPTRPVPRPANPAATDKP